MGKLVPQRSRNDWLRLIRAASADSGRVRLTRHARERMGERGVTLREVLNVVRRGLFDEPPSPALTPPGHWQARISDRSGVAVVIGFDPDGEPVILDVITVIRSH